MRANDFPGFNSSFQAHKIQKGWIYSHLFDTPKLALIP
jgi:hypothetical protein